MNVSDLDLSKLDFQNVGAWPGLAKGAFCLVLVILVGVGGYFLFVKEQIEQLDRTERREDDLRGEFSRKQEKAASLERFKLQLEEIRLILQQSYQVLPPREEMPQLLVNISQTALSAGIEIELFEPLAEVPRDFYAEKPITLRMVGTYHQFGAFVSAVAALPRIVLFRDDLHLRPDTRTGVPSGQLMLEGTVRTYRYLDADETAGADGAAQ